jgi:poly[(R)-3-hydroxyalkanoate] polymerase subunit PhaC
VIADDIVARLRRETERTAIRARNGLRYVAGSEWAPVQPTPSDVVWRQGPVELRRYRSEAVRFAEPVLMFIGLVSRSYILDLHRDNSIARRLRDAGFDVYLLDWGAPTAADAGNTLETYTLRLLPRAVRAVLKHSARERLTMLGYCMGGNFALLALGAQRLPVRSLIVMATPVDFSALGGLAGAIRDRDLDPATLIDWTGNVPPQHLAAFFRIRKPTTDIVMYARLWENLWNDDYVESHQAMARWASEHVAFPGAAFRQVASQWLRDNAFKERRLRVAGRSVDLGEMRCPTLAILALGDDLVPPAAAQPITEVVGADELELLELEGGHAGLSAGRKAATTTVPALIDWLRRHSDPVHD